jgi:hypothetical protein
LNPRGIPAVFRLTHTTWCWDSRRGFFLRALRFAAGEQVAAVGAHHVAAVVMHLAALSSTTAGFRVCPLPKSLRLARKWAVVSHDRQVGRSRPP